MIWETPLAYNYNDLERPKDKKYYENSSKCLISMILEIGCAIYYGWKLSLIN